VEVLQWKPFQQASRKHGSTGGIAQAIAERLRELGHEAQARVVEDIRDMGEAEALVLGSAVYAGSFDVR
jgi:menaquinone-dependent protoporphyrinogen oxidase